MSSILYKLEDGEVVQESVNSVDVGYLLTVGYASTPEQLTKKKKRKPKAKEKES